MNNTGPFGCGMDGMEQLFAELLSSSLGHFQAAAYMEIGVREGRTLLRVASVLSGLTDAWSVVGCDLPESIHIRKITSVLSELDPRRKLNLEMLENPKASAPIVPKVRLIQVALCPSREFLREHFQGKVTIALIDACHCSNCVCEDFLGVERFIVPGGHVLFHDTRPEQQSEHGCGHEASIGIQVLKGIERLGLDKGQQQGWVREATWKGPITWMNVYRRM